MLRRSLIVAAVEVISLARCKDSIAFLLLSRTMRINRWASTIYVVILFLSDLRASTKDSSAFRNALSAPLANVSISDARRDTPVRMSGLSCFVPRNFANFSSSVRIVWAVICICFAAAPTCSNVDSAFFKFDCAFLVLRCTGTAFRISSDFAVARVRMDELPRKDPNGLSE